SGGQKSIRASLVAAAREAAGRDTPELYEFGPFRLEPAERKLLRGNEVIALTPKAFDTLVVLVRNSGHLLEKDELIQMLWPDSFVEEGNLTSNVSLLRKALGQDPEYIETVPKKGYRFVGAVRQLPKAEIMRAKERREERVETAKETADYCQPEQLLSAPPAPTKVGRAKWFVTAGAIAPPSIGGVVLWGGAAPPAYPTT